MNSSDIIVVKLTDIESAQSGRLEGVLDVALKGRSVYEIHRAEEMTYFLKAVQSGCCLPFPSGKPELIWNITE